PWQLEAEDNNTVAQANTPTFTRDGSIQRAQVLGYIRYGDSGDVFRLGNLSAGTDIQLAYRQPASSPLVGILEVLNSNDTVVASAPASTTNLGYSIPAGQAGLYFARLRGQSGSEGLFAQYLLTLELSDRAAPFIVADTLPAEGSSVLALFDRFTLTFSEDMLAETVNAPASYDLRASGPDALFDTPDDVLWPVTLSPAYSSGLTASYLISGGALPPGAYRFTAKTALQDRAGNPLAVAYVRQFTVGQVPGFNTEREANDTSTTASPLAMTTTQPNLISGGGRGYLANSSDLDFWSFEAQAGDVMILSAENPGNPAGSGLYYELFDPNGTRLAFYYADNNGLLQSAPLALANTGVYTVRVSAWHSYYNETRLRVSLYRNGLAVEIEPNNALAAANALTFATTGARRSAVIAGAAQVSTDLDYFNLGVIEAGRTVIVSTRKPASSPLLPVVSLYNAAGTYLPEAGTSRPSDGLAEVRITQTGTYYALLRPGSGSAGLMSEYLLDVLILPTEDVSFPNLQVTTLNVPVTTGLRSGAPFSFAFTVTNVGSLATPVSRWFDRVVLSPDPLMDLTDLALGLYQHDGALAPGQGYSVGGTVNLPDGLNGDFYLVVKTDYTDTLNEFLLEGDNQTATESPFHIALADYPDLRIENLTLTGPDARQTYTLTWYTFNRGAASTPAGFRDRVLVRNQTTGAVVFDQTYLASASLAPGTSVHQQIEFTATAGGDYTVEVTTDSGREVFEHDGVSHESAERNTAIVTFAITQIYNVVLNVVPPGAGTVSGGGSYPAGAQVTVNATARTDQAPYRFENWIQGGVVRSSNPNYTFQINQDTVLTAVFGLPSFTLGASNEPSGAGTVVGTGSFLWGSTNRLTAQPTFGYRFSHWTENGATLSTNPVLTVVVVTNRVLVAHYAEAHLIHRVTTATLPAGLAIVSGAGTYTNGQTGSFSAPPTVTNAPPDYYAFKRFTLNGALFGTSPSFQKTFATTDPTNLLFVAEYELVDRTPPRLGQISVVPNVTSVLISWTTSEPTTGLVAYGLTTAYGQTNSSTALRTNHAFNVTGLVPATTYHFAVSAMDAAGNASTSEDRVFTTLAPPDLTPSNVSVPASSEAGRSVPLIFTLRNLGPGAALGPWNHALLVSPNADGSSAASLGMVSFNPGPGGLPGGGSIVVT
ncbi:MAG: CARDB domain-containing protein, partial [Verrucomicrobiales bacterium]|nr:CARDB domain-containing protein [Verrucomicrobiales bacterium]